MYRVYRHTAPNGKVYIGITKQDPERRWQNGCGYKQNKLFSRAIAKHGWDNIKHEILHEGLTRADAERIERELIARHQSNNKAHGYNITAGGANAWWFGKSLSPEHRRSIGKYWEGARNPNARSVICLETMKVYDTMKDAQDETGATKVCDCCKRTYKHRTSGGFHWSYFDPSKPMQFYADMLARMIDEESRPATMSESNKQKLIDRCSKKIQCVETGEVFSSLHNAAEKVGATAGNICKCCKGIRKTAAGYHWRYIE